MKYTDGQIIHLGDIVALAGQQGVVVCDIDGGQFSDDPNYSADVWSYLGEGIMARYTAYGLIHHTVPDPDLELIRRGDQMPSIDR
ncbi:hypothetical protein L2Y96_06035 [Luteibacter aegosomaticola]|uniref:hypothetical protein n=1 Tax=Luteibacter aegosomaticola TaxID=2911538 RepID=UPI001FF7D2E7|nr:hypothetical protein [Luteibacter aegosomaticola]UPG91330.1 hypothetical protein L2Y96_06035 [Luteibacter aegosomaticola]